MKNPIHTVTGSLATRRQTRQQRHHLESALAGYRTPSERLDLETLLDSHPDEETRELRDILSAQSMSSADRSHRLMSMSRPGWSHDVEARGTRHGVTVPSRRHAARRAR